MTGAALEVRLQPENNASAQHNTKVRIANLLEDEGRDIAVTFNTTIKFTHAYCDLGSLYKQWMLGISRAIHICVEKYSHWWL